MCFPSNSCTGVICKVLCGNNFLALDAACNSGRKHVNWRVVLWNFQADEETLTTALLGAGGFVRWSIQRLLICVVCLWHFSQHVQALKKHTMLKILCRLAWLQAVRMYILIFILPADIWIFYKYNVDRVFVFLYKSGLLSTQAWRGLPQERSFVSCSSPWFWMRHSPPLLSGGADLGVGSCHSLGSVWHSHSCV